MNDKTLQIFHKENLYYVHEHTPMNEVMRMMKEKRVGHILVLDEEQKLTGIISRNDVYKNLHYITTHSSGAQYSKITLDTLKAKDIMTSDPLCLQSSDPVSKAIDVLLNEHFHAIPVMEGAKVKGIVTAIDILNMIT